MNYEKQALIKHLSSTHKIDMVIIDTKLDLNTSYEQRDVVRGICIKDGKILVLYPKEENIYGIPGGGIEVGESHEDALKRELYEEVGALDIHIVEYLGKMTSYRKKYQTDQLFVPTHHLYLVDIKSFGAQHLIAYEEDLGLQFDFVDIHQVIETNELAIKKRNQAYLDFYTNQTLLFKTIKNIFHL